MSNTVIGSDKKVTVGIRRPGIQPGRWRLVLGKCAVGALALSRTPRIVRARVDEERGGRKAEIVDLSISKGGSVRSRVRRQHRTCHQKTILKEQDLTIGTWNTLTSCPVYILVLQPEALQARGQLCTEWCCATSSTRNFRCLL